MDHVLLGFHFGAEVEDVLDILQLTVSTSQVLVQSLHSLSVVVLLCHPYLPNILRYPRDSSHAKDRPGSEVEEPSRGGRSK